LATRIWGGSSWDRSAIFDTVSAPFRNDWRYSDKVRYNSQSMCIKLDVEPRIEILPVVYKSGNYDPDKEPFRLYYGRWRRQVNLGCSYAALLISRRTYLSFGLPRQTLGPPHPLGLARLHALKVVTPDPYLHASFRLRHRHDDQVGHGLPGRVLRGAPFGGKGGRGTW
jgi:hypothetical protein